MSQSLHLRVRVDLTEVRIGQTLPKIPKSKGKGRLVSERCLVSLPVSMIEYPGDSILKGK